MKNKGLAGFGQVANSNNSPVLNNGAETQEAILKKQPDFKDSNANIEQFYEKPSKPVRKQITIYLDTDVLEAFADWGKVNGKGAKSDLINNFLRQTLNVKG